MIVVLLLVFLLTPVIEIYVIIQVGQQIGAVPTVVLLLAESALGAWLVRREGRRAWQALRGAFGSGRLPSRELSDAALVLVGGTLLLTPGFVTDALGFLMILPVSRPVARRALAWLIARRAVSVVGFRPGGPTGAGRSTATGRSSVWPEDRVVPGEIVEDDTDTRGSDDGPARQG